MSAGTEPDHALEYEGVDCEVPEGDLEALEQFVIDALQLGDIGLARYPRAHWKLQLGEQRIQDLPARYSQGRLVYALRLALKVLVGSSRIRQTKFAEGWLFKLGFMTFDALLDINDEGYEGPPTRGQQ